MVYLHTTTNTPHTDAGGGIGCPNNNDNTGCPIIIQVLVYQGVLYVLGGHDGEEWHTAVYKLGQGQATKTWEVVEGVKLDDYYNYEGRSILPVVTFNSLHCN